MCAFILNDHFLIDNRIDKIDGLLDDLKFLLIVYKAKESTESGKNMNGFIASLKNKKGYDQLFFLSQVIKNLSVGLFHVFRFELNNIKKKEPNMISYG
jgi:hypothetical protein